MMSKDKPRAFASGERILLLHGTTTARLDAILRAGLASPFLTHSADLADYYACEAAEEDDGAPVILEVTVEAAALRYDGASMDEPVGFDDRTADELERLSLRVLAKMQSLHPEWVQGGYLVVPDRCYSLSLNAVGSCRHEGTVGPENILVESIGSAMAPSPPHESAAAEETPCAEMLM